MNQRLSGCLLVILIWGFLDACTTTTQSRRSRPAGKKKQLVLPKEKKGSKTPKSRVLTEADGRPVITQKTIEIFLRRQLSADRAFDIDDERYLEALPNNPSEGSLLEAAIVAGILRLANRHQSTDNLDFEEDNLDSTEPQVEISEAERKVSVEVIAKEKGVDMPKALFSNPFLKSFRVHQMALRALTLTSNSPEFNQSMQAAVSDEMGKWQSLSSTSVPLEDDQQTNDAKVSEQLSVADYRSGDAILIQAQNLANVKRYRQAISKAEQIKRDSPFYPSAQNKIINFSNDAVQELRQKAAQAFQSALPMSDPEARAAYLQRAKQHLQEALTKYPHAPAEQLTTVRENLAVITRDLERLSTSDIDE